MLFPAVDADSADWWHAVSEHRFVLPCCRACGAFFFPPMPRCAECQSTDVALRAAPTGGTVETFTVTRINLHEELAHELPYVLVLVRLAAGPRLIARLCGGEPSIDLAVEAGFVDLRDNAGQTATLLEFRPAGGAQ